MPSYRSRFFHFITKRATAKFRSQVNVTDARRFVNEVSYFSLLPKGISTEPVTIKNRLDAQWYIPGNSSGDRVILYLHGGAFTLGWSGLHDWLVGHICKACTIKALGIHYRLAPEHPFPAALEDCLTAYEWLLDKGFSAQRIFLAGDSCGGTLALSTLISLREERKPLPAGAVFICPCTDLTGSGPTFWAHKNSDVSLSPDFAINMFHHYSGDMDLKNPLLSPLYADLSDLPPLLLQTGGGEILFSDSTRLAERAREYGVRVIMEVYPEMWHLWHVYTPFMPESRQAVEKIGGFIKTL